jgi:hypothetical protein
MVMINFHLNKQVVKIPENLKSQNIAILMKK